MVPLDRNPTVFADNQAGFSPKGLNQLQDGQAEGFYFRTIAVKEYLESKEITVQFVRSVTSEKDMLSNLLLILVIGCSIGSVCAVGVGSF